MTPSQFRSILDAATMRPLRAVQRHGRGNWSIWQSDGDDTEIEVARSISPKLAAAICTTMNLADALAELWETATELADFTYSDSQAEAIERIGDVVRRLEKAKP